VQDEFGGEYMAEEIEEDIVRVLRIVEIIGPRSMVEKQIEDSITGMKVVDHRDGKRLVIRVATIGLYPEILEAACVIQKLTKPEQVPESFLGIRYANCGHIRREGGDTGRDYCTSPGCKNYVPF